MARVKRHRAESALGYLVLIVPVSDLRSGARYWMTEVFDRNGCWFYGRGPFGTKDEARAVRGRILRRHRELAAETATARGRAKAKPRA
jgi:hypothetical protein